MKKKSFKTKVLISIISDFNLGKKNSINIKQRRHIKYRERQINKKEIIFFSRF